MTKPMLFHTAELLEYSFGDMHPMGPDRVRLAMELSEHFGLLDSFDVVEPPPTDMDLVRRIHGDSYIEALKKPVPDIDFADVGGGVHHADVRKLEAGKSRNDDVIAQRLIAAGRAGEGDDRHDCDDRVRQESLAHGGGWYRRVRAGSSEQGWRDRDSGR